MTQIVPKKCIAESITIAKNSVGWVTSEMQSGTDYKLND